MKPPRIYPRGFLPFIGGIRRSTLLAYSVEAAASAAKAGRSANIGGSNRRIHPWAFAHVPLRRRILRVLTIGSPPCQESSVML